MKNAIILHGTTDEKEYYSDTYPSLSNSHWLPWLQKQLLIHGYAAATPEVPNAHKPDYASWCKEVERFPIGPDTILIGHSCGGGFWVRYLSEHREARVGKVILVAPWLDPDGDETKGFFDFEIDPKLAERTKGLVIFNSDNDMGNVHKSVAKLRDSIQEVQYKEFHKYGHFCYEDMNTEKFPELLETALS